MRIPVNGRQPQVDPSAWVAPGAVLTGDVVLAAEASVWFTSVLRGDGDIIRVGARTNIQDGCVLHTDPGLPLLVGADVSVGHRVVLHGCVIEDRVLVGMGSVVMNGARVGEQSLVAAGALLTEGTVVPPRSLVVGAPAKVRRELTDEEVELVGHNAAHYVALARRYAAG